MGKFSDFLSTFRAATRISNSELRRNGWRQIKTSWVCNFHH